MIFYLKRFGDKDILKVFLYFLSKFTLVLFKDIKLKIQLNSPKSKDMIQNIFILNFNFVSLNEFDISLFNLKKKINR